MRLRATVRKQNRLCRSRLALRSGPAEPDRPEEKNGCRFSRSSSPPFGRGERGGGGGEDGGGGLWRGASCPCHGGAGKGGMGVGAKMAKGAVVRSRSLLSGTSTRRIPRALPVGGRLLLLPFRCPHSVSGGLLCFPAVSRPGSCLGRTEGLLAHTWQGEGGSVLW